MSGVGGKLSPADWLEAKVEWSTLLEGAGATFVRTIGRRDHYTRPGKEGGTSATTGNGAGGGLLKVHSTNWPGLDTGRAYSKFAFYAAVEHRGDESAAARAIMRMPGYDGTKGPKDRSASKPTAPRKDAASEPEGGAASDPSTDAEPKTASVSLMLERLLSAAGTELWRNPEGEARATIATADGGRRNAPCEGREFTDHLRAVLRSTGMKPASKRTLDEAADHLSALARIEGPEHPDALRWAWHDGTLYILLADAQGMVLRRGPTGGWIKSAAGSEAVVRIAAGAWSLIPAAACPVRFLPPATAAPHPVPERGRDAGALWPFLNVAPEDRPLIWGFLVGAFAPPPGSLPLLVLTASAGSGKSTVTDRLLCLLDPATKYLTSPNLSDHESVMAAVAGTAVFVLNNRNGLRPHLSDLLCQLLDGGTLSSRRKGHNTDSVLVTARLPIIANGVADPVGSASDLHSRAIPVHLPPLSDAAKTRAERNDLAGAWEDARPGIFGALLDALARGEAGYRTAEPPRGVRLARVNAFVTGSEQGSERGSFSRRLDAAQSDHQGDVLSGDPRGEVILRVAQAGTREWTAAELMSEIRRGLPLQGLQASQLSSAGMGRYLARNEGAFAAVGVSVVFRRTAQRRSWAIGMVTGVGNEASSQRPDDEQVRL